MEAVAPYEGYGNVVRSLRRRLPSQIRSKWDAEDFVQDAIVQLLEHGDAPDQWEIVAYIATRRMIDAYRSPRARFHLMPDNMTAKQPSAHQLYVAKELMEWLEARAASPLSQRARGG